MQLLKGNSSKWIHESFPALRRFAWQEGYGAFSVNTSQINVTIRYIEWQQEHHRKRSFDEEFIAFLKKNSVSLRSEICLWLASSLRDLLVKSSLPSAEALGYAAPPLRGCSVVK